MKSLTQSNTTPLSNVTFWDFTLPDGERLQWSVYNDPFWLNCFILNPNYNRKKDSQGRTWEIDFKKGLITQPFN